MTNLRPARAEPADSQANPTYHKILVCLSCRREGSDDRPGPRLLDALRLALDAHPNLAAAYQVCGSPCMAGCARPCTVGWQAPGKATWLFGDINKDDIDALVAFARMYLGLADGWCRSAERPGKLAHTTLARIPAAQSLTYEGVWQ